LLPINPNSFLSVILLSLTMIVAKTAMVLMADPTLMPAGIPHTTGAV
jgi:hypothetical protein